MSGSGALLHLGARQVLALPEGALFDSAERLLFVADLHLGKGSAYAARGQMLPPYDTHATLARLAALVDRLDPRGVVCLGDSFHDDGAAVRLDAAARRMLSMLAAGRDWVWVTGNHDRAPPLRVPGTSAAEWRAGPGVGRHIADEREEGVELSGHYHPKARVRLGARRVSRPCFIEDGRRMILPAFGAFAGGLDVREPEISRLFPRGYRIHLTGGRKVYSFDAGSEALALD